MSDHIKLSPSSVNGLCPDCKAMLIECLGLASPKNDETIDLEADDDSLGHAELGIQAARAFLLGCNAKTENALRLIVASGDSFSIHALEGQMQVERGGLRGVWSGLTKRTRTITGDPDAWLIQWSDETEEGDYIGRLTTTTLRSFERALKD